MQYSKLKFRLPENQNEFNTRHWSVWGITTNYTDLAASQGLSIYFDEYDKKGAVWSGIKVKNEDLYYYYPANGYSWVKKATSQSKDIGIVPVIDYKQISDEYNGVRDGECIELGEFYQDNVSLFRRKKLERLYKKNKLDITGKKYSKKMTGKPLTEYIYRNKKYVRIDKDGKVKWCTVKPLKFKINLENKCAYCIQILFAGITRDEALDYLKTDFGKDIMPSGKAKVFETEDDSELVSEEDLFNEEEPIIGEVIDEATIGVNAKNDDSKKINEKVVSANNTILNTIYANILKLPAGPSRTQYEKRFNWLHGFFKSQFVRINGFEPTDEETLFANESKILLHEVLKYYNKTYGYDDDQVDIEMKEIKDNTQRRV